MISSKSAKNLQFQQFFPLPLFSAHLIKVCQDLISRGAAPNISRNKKGQINEAFERKGEERIAYKHTNKVLSF